MTAKCGWGSFFLIATVAAAAGFGLHRVLVSDTVPDAQPLTRSGDVDSAVVSSRSPESSFPPPLSRDGPTIEAQLDGLRQQLLEEKQARERLESELAAFGRELTDLRAADRLSLRTSDEFDDGSVASDDLPQPNDPGSVTTMVALGFSEERAAQLKKRVDKFALDRLSLWDTATREGWLNSERYRKELTQIDDAESGFRNELGEEEYDRMLYALGEPNRVAVQEVMLGSAAASVGLQAGDVLVSYDGRRIFKFEQLRGAIVEGAAGEPVEVAVQRDGQLQMVYIPRGPLGVRLDATRVLP